MDIAEEAPSLSICTDHREPTRSFYSDEPQDIVCQGVMNKTAGEQFNVTVQWN